MAQAIVGVVFTVLIFGRIVTVLPRIDSVIKSSPDD